VVGTEESQEIENLIFQEEKLNFETFKLNYSEFSTMRKLVQLINEKLTKIKENKYSQIQYPKHIVINLNANTNEISKKKQKKVTSTSSNEEISEEINEYSIGMRAQTGRSIHIKKKNEIFVENPNFQRDVNTRMKWKKKEKFITNAKGSSSEDMDDLYMIQKKIQIIQEAEEES